MDSSNNWQNKRVFSKKDDSGNVGNKGLRREEQNKFSPKKLSPVGIEPGTLRLLLCLPHWANLASVKRGIFNFTFVGTPIDFWT